MIYYDLIEKKNTEVNKLDRSKNHSKSLNDSSLFRKNFLSGRIKKYTLSTIDVETLLSTQN